MKEEFGRAIVLLGLVLSVAGLLLMFGERLPFRLGRLPGDIVWERGGTTIYLPIGTCILLSIVLSVLMWLFNRR